MSNTDLARLLSQVTQAQPHSTRPELLARVAHVCQQAFSVPIAVSITVGHPASPDDVASDSALAQHIDGAQAVAGEGPCASAFDTQRTVVSEDVGSDERWPKLALRLEGSPPLSVVAVPLEANGGAMSFYIDPTAETDLSAVAEAAELIATTLSAALQEIEIRTELEKLTDQLQTALKSRATIDQAKGILMARHRIGPDEAFQVLVRASSTTNIRLREIARRLVEEVGSSDEPI